MDRWPVTYTRKVRWSDTDAQGIVFNANYLTYFDDTVTDFFELLGIPSEICQTVVARIEMEFRSPARLGEVLVTGARVTYFGKTSVGMELRTWEDAAERLVATARQVLVCVDHKTLGRIPAPPSFIAAVERLQGAPVERRGGAVAT